MTRADALIDLLAAVEAGTATTMKFDDALCGWPDPFMPDRAEQAYHGSVDAAIAFAEAVLPGAWWQLRSSGKYGHAAVDIEDDIFEAFNLPTPARALLISALKALIAQEEA